MPSDVNADCAPECEYFDAQSRSCEIATQIAGRSAKTNPSACIACRRRANWPDPNDVTVSMAFGAVRTDAAATTAIMARYGHLLARVPGTGESAETLLRRILTGQGVGSQLWHLLSSLGIEHRAGCGCLHVAVEMNRLGPDGCRANRARLVQQMDGNAAQYGWSDVARAAGRAIATGLVFRLRLTDLYGSLLDEAIRRAELAASSPPPPGSGPQKLILGCTLCPGDLLTLTAAVESLHRAYPGEYLTDVRTPCPDLWRHNPRLTAIADDDPDAITVQMHYPAIQRCNQVSMPFLAGYTEYLGRQLGRPLQLQTNRPHVYLGPGELRRPRSELWPGAPDLAAPYWIVNAGVKSDMTAKQWPFEYYQAVVDATRGRIQWVQVGLAEHDHPRLRGVIDCLDTGPPMRELMLLAYHAAGGLGPITFLQHLMAAVGKPYLCLAGGREPATWIQYPRQHTFHTIGQLDCCRDASCWCARVVPLGDGEEFDRNPCRRPITGLRRPVAACLHSITPPEVLAVLTRLTAGPTGRAESARADGPAVKQSLSAPAE